MKVLAIEHEMPDIPEDSFRPFLKAEALRVWELYQAGVIREIYFRADRSEAILVLEAESLDAARQAVDSLPLVQQSLASFEFIPLAPYPGFARLFDLT